MSSDASASATTDVNTLFAGIVGQSNIISGDDMDALATDVYRAAEKPLLIVRPESVEQLQAVVRAASGAGIAMSVRGGGASYTDAYTPARTGQILIDMGSLNKVVTIDETNGFVTVEAGCTWAAMRDALAARNLRTPFFGPFSGLHATVGGSMSQNSISHGSGAWGISADSVLAFDVVTADGSLLSTGSAVTGGLPFARHYGPDLTGLFTGDGGTLGIKARVTLPVIRRRPEHLSISLAFADLKSAHELMRRVAIERIEDSHFALDAALSQGQIARQERAGANFAMALSILKSSPSLVAGMRQLMHAATTAKKAIGEAAYSVHYIVEGFSDGEVKGRIHRIRELASGLGWEIPATVPAVVRGMPFAPFYNTLGPKGERWVPLHGVLPHANVAAFEKDFRVLLADRAAELKSHGVWTGEMFSTVGSGGFLFEIAIYWPDAITAYHRKAVPADYLASLPTYPENPAARAVADQLKRDCVDLLVKHGAINFQLGRAYPYVSRLQPEAARLVKALKGALDPNGLVSPGNLGLS